MCLKLYLSYWNLILDKAQDYQNLLQFIIFFMKIRLNLLEEDIAYHFGIHVSTVSWIFHYVLDVMYIKIHDISLCSWCYVYPMATENHDVKLSRFRPLSRWSGENCNTALVFKQCALRSVWDSDESIDTTSVWVEMVQMET